MTLASVQGWAQPSLPPAGITTYAPQSNKINSPLSRYGIGDLLSDDNSTVLGMGGISTAYNNPFTINSANPATYAFLKATTFDVAVQARSLNVHNGDKSFKPSTYTLSNLALAFPIAKNAGLSFGFKPHSNLYYNANDTGVVNGLGTVYRNYYGQGSLQKIYLGAAYKFKGLSLGVNANYHFGNLMYSSSMETDSVSLANSEFVTHNRINGFDFNLGLMYQYVFNESYYIHFGATYGLGNKLNNFTSEYAMSYRYNVSGNSTVLDPIDTLPGLSYTDRKSTIQLPTTLALGVHVGKSSFWNVGVDFEHTDWSKFEKNGLRTNVADQTMRIAIGGEVVPNPLATTRRFVSNLTFRLGAYYGEDYVVLNDHQLKYMGATIAIGLPLFKGHGSDSRGVLNATFDVGRRYGDGSGPLSYSENYFKFNLGLNFNDIWFKKRKFD